MTGAPRFPHFKPLTIDDTSFVGGILRDYGSETSELNFTNLFIWRNHYGFQWSIREDWLLVAGENQSGDVLLLEPVGPEPRQRLTVELLQWLREERRIPLPAIHRADRRIVEELRGAEGVVVEPARDQFDYVYLREDLVRLEGNRYRSKRNHFNKFNRTYRWFFAPLTEEYIPSCLELQESWCRAKRCEEDLSLLGEWDAVKEILSGFHALDLMGGVITVDGKVEAFSVGEVAGGETAVVHIEKANPLIPELYAVINQQCCEHCWLGARFVNREQDLGVPGLREAKMSYHPHHFAEKYVIRLAGDYP